MPVFRNPTPLPLQAGQQSVLDSPLMKAMQILASILGANDPAGQAMGVAAPLTVAVPGAPLLGRPLPELLTRKGPLNYEMRKPVMQRLEALLSMGRARPAEWADATPILEALNNDPALARRWARGWGATSPGTDFVQNTKESLRALALHQQGQPFSREALKELRFTNAPAKIPNLNRAYQDLPLSGDKAEAMAGFMSGEARVPIDRHALDAMGAVPAGGAEAEMKLQPLLSALRQSLYEREGLARGALSDSDLYRVVESAWQKALQDLAPNDPLRQTFASIWEGTRVAKGLPYYGGVNEVLQKLGVLGPGGMTDAAALMAKTGIR